MKKSLAFLILDTYYPAFLRYFYDRNKELIDKSYEEQKSALMSEFFGTADFYSRNLEKLGNLAEDIIANNEILQKQWAKEQGIKIKRDPFWLLYKIPYFTRLIKKESWIYQILEAQIKKFKPDIIYSQDLGFFSPKFLKKIKQHCRLLIGQIACPMPPEGNLQVYDLILTSFPHYVERFRKMGIQSKYFKISFEETILDYIKPQPRKYNVVFIGGFLPIVSQGTKVLERLASQIPLDIWGYGIENLSLNSPLRKYCHGQAWGKKMYQIFNQSKIVINRHSQAAENYANNMRLYEATGMGAMLITDYKDNLPELFQIGKEVESYKNTEELIEKVKYYLNHDSEREKIAAAGQKRTLKEHTYFQRMQQLIKIINQYL